MNNIEKLINDAYSEKNKDYIVFVSPSNPVEYFSVKVKKKAPLDLSGTFIHYVKNDGFFIKKEIIKLYEGESNKILLNAFNNVLGVIIYKHDLKKHSSKKMTGKYNKLLCIYSKRNLEMMIVISKQAVNELLYLTKTSRKECNRYFI